MLNRLPTSRILSLPIGILAMRAAMAQGAFKGLGDLPGGGFASEAYGVSGDGQALIGHSPSTNGDPEGFRCMANVLQGLGDLPGSNCNSLAYGTNRNGSVVVGHSDSDSEGPQAFRWTQAGGIHGIGYLPGGRKHSAAFAVSAGGDVIAGYGIRMDTGREAFRWTEAGGMIGLGDFDGGSFNSSSFGVSADGSIVVGFGTTSQGPEAFKWTAETGMIGLGDLPGGGFYSIARGISANGHVIVGMGAGEHGFEAVRWVDSQLPSGGSILPGDGTSGLGDLDGGNFESAALATNDDGEVVVGYGSTVRGREAFYWTRAGGMKSLAAMLASDYGLNLAGWTLTEATGVSYDGSIIVGNGIDPYGRQQAWMARVNPVPEPTGISAIGIGLLGLFKLRRRRSSAPGHLASR